MRPLKYTDFVRNFENNLASDAAHLSYFLYYRIVNLQAAKFFKLACTITWFCLVNIVIKEEKKTNETWRTGCLLVRYNI